MVATRHSTWKMVGPCGSPREKKPVDFGSLLAVNGVSEWMSTAMIGPRPISRMTSTGMLLMTPPST